MSDWLYTFIESIQIVCFSKMILIWLFSKNIYYILYIYIFNVNMSIENPERLERLERTEAYLKQRLSEYKSVMPVKGWDGVTLLEIYWEWMEYLVKENLKKRENPKKRNNFIEKWRRFLLEYNTDAIADLLIGFFDAKRRYGRDRGRGEDKRDWFALCKNYCNKNGWHGDEDFLYSLFSSYSAAERRIYKKAEAGEVLADTSKSLLQIMALNRDEIAKKEEEKKRKAEEKMKKEEEKRKRKEKREKKAEENKLKKLQKKKSKKEELIEKKSEEILEDNEKEVDPDYPKAPEWWSGPTDSRFNWPIFQADEENWEAKENVDNSKKDTIIRDENWNLRRTSDGQYLLDFGE